MTEREVELRRAIRTRDAFLAVIAEKLEAHVVAFDRANARTRREALEHLVGFARELRVIAEPHRPVLLRTRKLELTAMLARTFDPAQLAERGAVVEVARGGTIVGRWDEEHLGSILGELVSNAMKYGGGKPVTIRARVRGAFAEVVVTNAGTWRGPGRVERFRREERRRSVRGYGIGLWLMQRLAQAHGGRVRFTSARGETSAIVSLPFEAAGGDVSRFSVRITPLERP